MNSSMKRRPILGLALCGLLVTACFVAESGPAAAFRMGGFGRAGGFGGAASGIRRPAPGRGGGTVLGVRSGRTAGSGGSDYGRGPIRHRIFGRGFHRYPEPTVSQPGGGRGNTVFERRRGGGNGGRGGTPLPADQRFVPDEIITAFMPGATPRAIAQMARRHDLTRLESQNFPLIGSALYRWRIGGRRSVADVVRALQRERVVASVQPNYVFAVQERPIEHSADRRGNPAQYALDRLQIEQAHQVATGKNILVAVIDSEIDAKHPDLDGAVVKSFDALGGEDKPQGHGTAMAGAIAAHGRLLGIAPDAPLLAARAFADAPGGAKGTSFAIYKGLQWAADNGARVVNMSFVGPADPTLHRMLAAANDKGMVLIAAAGNAGPNSPPLYPAADPDVIAVTATDSNDSLFKMANRGPFIAVSAPGVDILALAPDGSYQIATGTSIAAAEVSGLAALALELNPSLAPGDVRTILMATATPLGPPGGNSDFGAGLVNAYRAVTSLNGKSKEKADDGLPEPRAAK